MGLPHSAHLAGGGCASAFGMAWRAAGKPGRGGGAGIPSGHYPLEASYTKSTGVCDRIGRTRGKSRTANASGSLLIPCAWSSGIGSGSDSVPLSVSMDLSALPSNARNARSGTFGLFDDVHRNHGNAIPDVIQRTLYSEPFRRPCVPLEGDTTRERADALPRASSADRGQQRVRSERQRHDPPCCRRHRFTMNPRRSWTGSRSGACLPPVRNPSSSRQTPATRARHGALVSLRGRLS